MHEWVKDYQRIQSETEMLDHHIEKGGNVAVAIDKQTVIDELNVMLEDTNKMLLKKEDQLNALTEISTMFTGVEHEVFVRGRIENQSTETIANDLGTSLNYVEQINMELLNLLEFYSEYN